MNISPDFMFERDSLKAQLKRWKWLFVGMLILAFMLIAKNTIKTYDKEEIIARMRIDGVLQHDDDLIKKLKEIGNDQKIKAVVVHIDSPGGDAYAGESLYIELKKLSKQKPVVAVLDTLAASAGYMIALGTDHIIARNMTLTGSIGVIWQSFELVDMANKLGIEFVSIKSSPLKAAPNPLEKMTKEVQDATKQTIDDSYDVFLAILMESRKMTREQALKLADGRVYTGIRAKNLNLIDEIGGEEEAIVWLETNKKISTKAHIVNINVDKPEGLLKELSQFFRNTNHMLMQIFGRNGMMVAK
jgi:protease-4